MSTSEKKGQEFFSAESHIRKEDNSLDEVSARADAIVENFLTRASSIGERSRLLSEEETVVMNEKIDRLIAALDHGRQLCFSPDAATGNVDISAAYNRPVLGDSRSGLEVDIAASRGNFGNIVPAGHHRRRIRSTELQRSNSTTSSNGRNKSSSERATAEIDIAHAFQNRSEGLGPPPARKSNAAEIVGDNAYRGKYLAYMDDNKVNISTISPIPFDFNKAPRPTTPSVDSGDSDLDCSSPLFEKSIQVLLREMGDAEANTPQRTNLSCSPKTRDAVYSWLEQVDIPSTFQESKNSKGKQRTLNVFHDGHMQRLTGVQSEKNTTLGKALRDVSKLRRPGYLQHNSFAKIDKTAADQTRPVNSLLAKTPFGGGADTGSIRSDTRAISPLLMSDELSNRAADFDFALARLEGRVPPREMSPIRRYADKSGIYGDDVEIENAQLLPHQPILTRNVAVEMSTTERLEKSLRDGPGE